jgi:LacI family transcriptional regulator
MGKVTIKDIAALVNTSPKTVSKALNNQPGVSKELRKKIKRKARELNYVPNIFGKGLSGKPSKTIGVIITDNANPMYSLILSELEKQAAESNYNIILCNSYENIRTEKKLIHILLEKQVEGIIIRPVDNPETYRNLRILQQLEIPYIIINRAIPDQEHPCIRPNNFLASRLAGQYLIHKGHSNILHLTLNRSVLSVEERIEGLKKVFQENTLVFREENVYRRCEVSVESAYSEMLTVLKERRDFTAVFAYNDITAFGVMQAVHECHLRIPTDIAIMGVDNLAFSNICLVPLTTVNHNLRAVGTVAMEALLRRIREKQNNAFTKVPDPYIVERESV